MESIQSTNVFTQQALTEHRRCAWHYQGPGIKENKTQSLTLRNSEFSWKRLMFAKINNNNENKDH